MDNQVKRILSAAYRLFAERGYDATSMNMIAARAGVSKGGLYHHFQSKEALLIALLESMYEKIMDAEMPDLTKLSRASYKASLISIGLGFIKGSIRDEQRKRLQLNLYPVFMRNDKLFKKMMPLLDHGLDRLSQLVRRGVELGALPKNSDVSFLTQKIFVMLDALEMYTAFEVKLPVERIWRDFVDSLIS